jgi:hypothetical protein
MDSDPAPFTQAQVNTLSQIGAAALFFMQCCIFLVKGSGAAVDEGRLMTVLVGAFFDLLADAWGPSKERPPVTAAVERVANAVRVSVQVPAGLEPRGPGSLLLRALSASWSLGGGTLAFEVSGASLAAASALLETPAARPT